VTLIVSGAATAGGSVLAASSGWTSPTGLAAFITAVVGLAAFLWSIWQASRRRHDIDVEAAAELIRALKEQSDER
jgi:uncharacterized membrane protein YhaH (DUF805 family)